MVDFEKKKINFEDYYLGRNDVEERTGSKVDYLVYYKNKYGLQKSFLLVVWHLKILSTAMFFGLRSRI